MGFWTFVFAISIASIVAGVVTTWIRAKHGYPMDQAKESDGKTDAGNLR